MRSSSLLFVLGVMGLLSLACAKHPDPPPAERDPVYSYTASGVTGGQGISIAVIAPATSDRLTRERNGKELDPRTQNMNDAIGRSQLQYLTGAGMTVSGPFKDVNAMTYPEKKQTDLLLTTEFDLTIHYPNADGVLQGGGSNTIYYKSHGDCSLGGAITFVMWEPLSMQRMWSKTVDIPVAAEDCTVKNEVPGVTWAILMYNVSSPLYEQAFANTMTTAERYFNPEEVALVKKQSAELREKKVY